LTTDIVDGILKSACREKDELENRKFKIAQLFKPLDHTFGDKKERELNINAMLKSTQTLEEIETFCKWRLKNSNSEEIIRKIKNETPGVF
jgi:hypothetical protein